MSTESINSPNQQYLLCTCDPSVYFFITTDPKECKPTGCFFYLIIFICIYSHCSYLALLKIRNYTLGIATLAYALLSSGSFLIAVRQLMLILQSTDYFSIGILLLIPINIVFLAYLFILIYWCKIVIAVVRSQSVIRAIKIVQYILIAISIITIVALVVGVKVWWPYYITNLMVILFSTFFAIGFFVLYYLLEKEKNKIESDGIRLSKLAYKRLDKLKKLSQFVIVSSSLLAIILIVTTSWIPKKDTDGLIWLFLNRTSFAMFVYGLNIFELPSTKENLKENSNSKGSDMGSIQIQYSPRYHSNNTATYYEKNESEITSIEPANSNDKDDISIDFEHSSSIETNIISMESECP